MSNPVVYHIISEIESLFFEQTNVHHWNEHDLDDTIGRLAPLFVLRLNDDTINEDVVTILNAVKYCDDYDFYKCLCRHMFKQAYLLRDESLDT